MHHGFWENGVRTMRQASEQTNRSVAQYGKFKRGMKILDAGCGFGGTALQLAREIGVTVTGVSLEAGQIAFAQHTANKLNLSDLTEFLVADYTKLPVSANSFDAAYAVESLIHATDKSTFFAEMHRVLKPKGRLVIVDGCFRRKPQTAAERQLVADYCEAFALGPPLTAEELQAVARSNGFAIVRAENKLAAVLPSIRFLDRLVKLFSPIVWLASWIPSRWSEGLVRNQKALSIQMQAVQLGMFDYWLFVFRKL